MCCRRLVQNRTGFVFAAAFIASGEEHRDQRDNNQQQPGFLFHAVFPSLLEMIGSDSFRASLDDLEVIIPV